MQPLPCPLSSLPTLTILEGLGAVSEQPSVLHRSSPWKSVYIREINSPNSGTAGVAGDVRLAWKPPRWDLRFFLFGKGVGQSPEQGSVAQPHSAAGPSQSLAARCAGVASDLATGLGQKESAGFIVYKGSVLPQCSEAALRAPSPTKTSGCKEKCLEEIVTRSMPEDVCREPKLGRGREWPLLCLGCPASDRAIQKSPRRGGVGNGIFGFVAELLNVLD